jgi:hypothetical protein
MGHRKYRSYQVTLYESYRQITHIHLQTEEDSLACQVFLILPTDSR